MANEPTLEGSSKRVALSLNQLGIELTPDQVTQIRDSALAKVRKKMADSGYTMPESDVELIAKIQLAMNRTGGLKREEAGGL